MDQPSEKRSFPRVPVTLTAHCRVGTRFLRDVVADLSVGGLFLRTREPVRPGAEVRVALALPSSEGPRFCTLVGSVARIQKDGRGLTQGVGVSFEGQDIAAGDRAALTGFLSQQAA